MLSAAYIFLVAALLAFPEAILAFSALAFLDLDPSMNFSKNDPPFFFPLVLTAFFCAAFSSAKVSYFLPYYIYALINSLMLNQK